MSGMPGTGCPTCSGKGRVPGHKIGVDLPFVICPTCGGAGRAQLEVREKRIVKICGPCKGSGEIENGKTCHRCRGMGKQVEVEKKANPAFIPSTRPRDYDDDTTSQRIDYLVCTGLTENQQYTILQEYVYPGTSFEKAEKAGITFEAYRMRLMRARDKLEELFYA